MEGPLLLLKFKKNNQLKQQSNFICKTIIMLNNVLAEFYERDIRRLIEEVKLFKDEKNSWKTEGQIKNSAGNLVLHIIGGTNYLIGTTLGNTGYVRNRDQEFIQKGVERKILIAHLEELIIMINKTLQALTSQQMEGEFPIFFDKPKTSTIYVLMQLLLHLNYHMGQINYLRRILE